MGAVGFSTCLRQVGQAALLYDDAFGIGVPRNSRMSAPPAAETMSLGDHAVPMTDRAESESADHSTGFFSVRLPTWTGRSGSRRASVRAGAQAALGVEQYRGAALTAAADAAARSTAAAGAPLGRPGERRLEARGNTRLAFSGRTRDRAASASW
jgi:hypothetical protein